ncbi:MAG: outer membrane lipoprotein carrier protein LolA [Cytophagales bacterium]|nr:outer membrane lipoprotein carrier protein LolA [Cytophagales bacterium]
MKKVILLFTIVILTLEASAQYDPDAKVVLDAMSAKYKKVVAFSASFSQKMENKSAGIDESLDGKITVKGGKYKLEILDSEVYNNGKEVWVFTPELEEVTVSTYDPTEEEITPGNVYDLYKQGFKYALISEMSNGDRVIELDPESREKSYHKIRMIIDANNGVKSFTVFEKTGNRYLYTVTNFKPMSSLSDTFFNFDTAKYPDVEIVDFR